MSVEKDEPRGWEPWTAMRLSYLFPDGVSPGPAPCSGAPCQRSSSSRGPNGMEGASAGAWSRLRGVMAGQRYSSRQPSGSPGRAGGWYTALGGRRRKGSVPVSGAGLSPLSSASFSQGLTVLPGPGPGPGAVLQALGSGMPSAHLDRCLQAMVPLAPHLHRAPGKCRWPRATWTLGGGSCVSHPAGKRRAEEGARIRTRGGARLGLLSAPGEGEAAARSCRPALHRGLQHALPLLSWGPWAPTPAQALCPLLQPGPVPRVLGGSGVAVSNAPEHAPWRARPGVRQAGLLRARSGQDVGAAWMHLKGRAGATWAREGRGALLPIAAARHGQPPIAVPPRRSRLCRRRGPWSWRLWETLNPGVAGKED